MPTRKLFLVSLFLGSLCAVASAKQTKQQTTASRPTVLITGNTETDTLTSANGAATDIGGVVVAGGGAQSSTYAHSEVWEVVRRFDAECPAAVFVTNPKTSHTLTIRTVYQKVNGGLVFGTVTLYQLVLLDSANNPLYISKKNWLRREIKPICKVIQRRHR